VDPSQVAQEQTREARLRRRQGKTSSFINDKEFIDQLSDCHIFKCFASRIYLVMGGRDEGFIYLKELKTAYYFARLFLYMYQIQYL
jgi:hypothetical protein